MVHLDTLDTNTPTTLPSIYNVMAMDARPPKTKKKKLIEYFHVLFHLELRK